MEIAPFSKERATELANQFQHLLKSKFLDNGKEYIVYEI